MTIPIVEEMHCEICDDNPTQTVMKDSQILCGFCGRVMYTFDESDRVTDFVPNWSKELRDIMNSLEPLDADISRMDNEGGSQPVSKMEEE